ncbi:MULTISPECIES: NAD(P)H-dependent flavin oxidoreductase [Geobacillus]|jgi:NADH:quinone reductase (non-electrogenic)|uniref:Probable nitronate monooxygenase n=1 Tax=Geobacillus thermodenitrificans TaxID=33940 RepID=A0ABY9QGY3_GEOTD|nr:MULTISPECIES: nitronate monooxygenase family protein [Geobacillus]ARP42064.1 putative nitronate monooxygenase [Geobacillus thermodenitrificans]ATO36591.1 2-nitropropane dioxygenase [Geobacillus thermodenitrificans]KQB94068.1 Nitronate monooxygenase [Geobacillus sp. PA-3]MEC5188429.1 nitronate monooxygenase [Geobacillus thermodenitrificans]MED0663806.1 nitronate monooxygenase [Geobacillus thermodenitrificans]
MEWKTRVTELLGITYPIIQGGLAYLAYADLAAAVSNAGGLGQITAMSLESPERLREEIRKVKEKTDRPFGVNFAIGQHGRAFSHMLEAALDEGVPVVSVTGGNPAPFFEQLKGTDVKTLVLVAAVRQAVKAEELGADAVMVVGQEGGGHLGKYDTGTFVLIPKVVESVSIPVIASGGIADGRGLMAALALGAEGIEMGTRFIATKECVHAHPVYKEMIVNATEHDTVVIKRSLGAPGRAIANQWTEKILEIERQGGTYEDLKEYISGEANRRFIYEGKVEEGFAWAGQAIGLIRDIPSVAELFARMIGEAEQIRRRWAN